MAQTLFWYDLETFGRSSRADRIAQFAGVRTNDRFEIIGERLVLYNRITPDYMPDPYACMVTGITPQVTLSDGLCEYEFISRIHREFMVPGTTALGYNSIRFDDEFIRNTLYRNFFDPYRREWSQGNSRWDIIDLVRATHDLRPEGITWPVNSQGRPSFRLEELTAANGISHEQAHDAMSDVLATIAMARLIHQRQPKLFAYYFSHRKKDSLKRLVNLAEHTPLLHTAGVHTSDAGCTTLVAPIGMDGTNRNALITIDLRYDPSALLDLDVEELRRRVFTSRAELEAEEDLARRFGQDPDPQGLNQGDFAGRIPLTIVHLNRSPFLAPLKTLTDQAAERLGLDLAACQRHAAMLRSEPRLIQKIMSVFSPQGEGALTVTKDSEDPDFQIYSGGFFRDEDKQQFETIHDLLSGYLGGGNGSSNGGNGAEKPASPFPAENQSPIPGTPAPHASESPGTREKPASLSDKAAGYRDRPPGLSENSPRDVAKDRSSAHPQAEGHPESPRNEGKRLLEIKQEVYQLHFQDPRIPQMLRRFFARNFPEALTEREHARWLSFCAGRLLYHPLAEGTDLATASKVITAKMESADTPARDKVILRALKEYVDTEIRKVLEYGD